MSIQPVNKAVEQLINSTPVLENKTKRKKSSQSLSIKNSKGVGGGGGGHSHKQSEGLGGVLWGYKIGLKHFTYSHCNGNHS